MRRGTTTMNMISSTSTTSTRGVMLISDCRPLPDSPWLRCMISVSLCAGALGVQPLAHLRRHHQEDDQKHKHHVDERRDVDARLQPARLTEPHTPALPS